MKLKLQFIDKQGDAALEQVFKGTGMIKIWRYERIQINERRTKSEENNYNTDMEKNLDSVRQE